MLDQVERMQKMLFNYQTTNRTDYRGGEVKPPIFTFYKKKPVCLTPRPAALKDVHTLVDWKSSIPFHLMHKPRPIIDTDPRKIQERYEKPPDLGKEEAIKTRPRLVMTPAVGMDDIDNREAREILCEDMYTSDMTRGMREGVSPYFSVKAPFIGRTTPSNPITLPRLNPPYVSPEWRMTTASWDGKQLRTFCDTTTQFWLAQDVPPCKPCQQTAAVKANRRMICQLKDGRR